MDLIFPLLIQGGTFVLHILLVKRFTRNSQDQHRPSSVALSCSSRAAVHHWSSESAAHSCRQRDIRFSQPQASHKLKPGAQCLSLHIRSKRSRRIERINGDEKNDRKGRITGGRAVRDKGE
ncbi:hypothetical protein RRG08_002683 [Elysia crispata]|uniref:Uncharacterized protein n=1 Tax=Elysia crispata TaxID=231223 RepID=A0AAE0XTV7_9GAST|nr:hypothetical protein RRG08_002683 [Elysia crispata]